MYTINSYINNIFQFVNSLIINIPAVGIQMNQSLLNENSDEYNLTIIDKREWKYYINLSGEYHSSDETIYIRDLKSDNKLILNKTLLNDREDIREELLKFKDYYNELLDNYPKQESLIKGIMLPVDIDIAINSKDGEILNYNNKLINSYELNIIDILNDYIQEYFSKWFNIRYMVTDEYYISYKLAILYSSILLKIYNIRLDNIHTDRVHDFFLDEFFNSHKYLKNDVTVLNREVKLWLYRNLRYIDNNIGKQQVLDSIILNLFDKMGVGVGEMKLTKEISTLDLNLTDLNNSVNKDKNILIETNKLNNSYSDRDNTQLPLNIVLENELKNDIDNPNELNYVINHYVKEINSTPNITNNNKSKILELDLTDRFNFNPYDNFKTILDSWMYTAYYGIYSNSTIFIDPNTEIEYRLTPMDGFILLLKLISDMNKIDNPIISKYKYFNLYIDNFNTEYIDKLISKNEISELTDYIKTIYPKRDMSIKDSDEFYNYITTINDFNSRLNILRSNINNMVISNDIKTIESLHLTQGEIEFNKDNLNIDKLLSDLNIDIKISSGYDYLNSIYELIKTFTNIDFGYKYDLEDTIKKYVNILNKLTSYTVQVLPNVKDSFKERLNYSSLELNKDITILNYKSGRFKCLEDLDGVHRVQVFEDLKDEENSKLSHIEIDSDYNIRVDKCIDKPRLNGYTDYNPDSSGIVVRVQQDDIKCIELYKPKIISVVTTSEFKSNSFLSSINVYEKRYCSLESHLEYTTDIYTDIDLYVKK